MKIISISGIRGVIGSDLSVNDFILIGNGFGKYIKGGTCAVGRDTRSTGKTLTDGVISGLIERGCNVTDLGVTSTPAVFREVLKSDLEGGIMITASHNPSEWNGAKFVIKGGRGLFENELCDLLETFKSSTSFEGFKRGYSKHFKARYPSDIVSYVGKKSCLGLKVILDLGGGAGCYFIDEIFKELGCEVVTINGSAGVFLREMDPTRDKLEGLSEAVRASCGDMGVAYDCDADRVVFVDNEGVKLNSDYVLLIYLKYLADSHLMKDVVVSLDTSLGVEDLVEGAGCRVFYSKVGEANIVRRMFEEKISIGGEGSSGGLIVSDFNFCRDGVLASTIVAKMVKQYGGFRKIIDGLPKYFILREKITCSKEDSARIIQILSKEEKRTIDSTDGLKIRSDSERYWILIRPSGTEHILRISVEARTKEKATGLMNYYRGRIMQIMMDGEWQ